MVSDGMWELWSGWRMTIVVLAVQWVSECPVGSQCYVHTCQTGLRVHRSNVRKVMGVIPC